MDTRLVKSILSLAVVVALGVGGTYAAFTSNTVTISNNTMAAGEANIKLCNLGGAGNWRNLINPSLTLGDLVPGGPEAELTAGSTVLVGNDSGDLDVNGYSGCNSYFDAEGSSDVDLKMVPTVANTACTDTGEDLKNKLELKLEFFDSTDSSAGATTWRTLDSWDGNTTTYGPTFNPDNAYRVRMYGRLKSTATDTQQGESCTFDINLDGKQA